MTQVRVHFKLEQFEGYPPETSESVWTQPSNDGLEYFLDNIPFFITEATLGDRISVTLDEDGRRWYLRTTRASTNSLIRVVVFQEQHLQTVPATLRGLGCDVEILASRHLLAVNIPATIELGSVQAHLATAEAEGILDYEEPILRQ
ncbi:DUF4265 domain-containing protein [Stenotrophomonas sp.]|uniref:DUF4265 domain-containing protein n=1 Tax=Stenotrophomonas sp. TaxID=69392 RepID=UPI0028A68894|nr:DUF4265 domain-containing protein [Stenotrophomonas sp.]